MMEELMTMELVRVSVAISIIEGRVEEIRKAIVESDGDDPVVLANNLLDDLGRCGLGPQNRAQTCMDTRTLYLLV
jgi:hypothetical protein